MITSERYGTPNFIERIGKTERSCSFDKKVKKGPTFTLSFMPVQPLISIVSSGKFQVISTYAGPGLNSTTILRFFAQLQILRKLRFFAVLVIFVKFIVLVEPFRPQIWPISAQLQMLRKLRFFGILVIFAVFVKFVVLVGPFNKF